MRHPTEIALDLVEAGLDAKVARLIVELVVAVSTSCPPDKVDASTRHEVDTVEARRAWDREYRRKKRANSTGKQTMSGVNAAPDASTQRPPDIHPTKVDTPCDLSSLSSFAEPEEGIQVGKEGKKKVRGSRITREEIARPEYREFCRTRVGWTSADIDRGIEEFFDYWSAVPGQRGVKLDWLATWRNRVRDLEERNGTGNRQDRGGAAAGSHKPPTASFLTGMAAVLATRPDSRLYRGDEGGRGQGPNGRADDREEPITLDLGPDGYREAGG